MKKLTLYLYLSLIVALFCWYNAVYGTGNIWYWMVAVAASIIFLVYFFRLMNIVEQQPLRLYPGEEIIKDLRGIKWIGSTFLNVRLGNKNLAVTNKRLALSGQFFGVETYKMMVMSFFYNKTDYDKNKGMKAWLLKSAYMKDGDVVIEGESETLPNIITWKFKENQEFILETVKKFQN